MMTNLPKSRRSETVVQALGKELLVYDLSTNKAFCLNETSMIVFEACTEGKTFEDLKREHQFTEDLIYLTLDTLAKENLISREYQSKLTGISRREAIRQVGMGTIIALPVISALIAPKATDAASVTCVISGGAAAGTTVYTSTTNPSNNTTTNQNFAGASLSSKCCSGAYRNFISNGCSNGIGATCNAQATCT